MQLKHLIQDRKKKIFVLLHQSTPNKFFKQMVLKNIQTTFTSDFVNAFKSGMNKYFIPSHAPSSVIPRKNSINSKT